MTAGQSAWRTLGLTALLGVVLPSAASRIPASSVTSPSRGTASSARAEAGDPDALARDALFEIAFSYKRDARADKSAPQRVQVGFLVGEGGIGVTALSAFHQADDVSAVLGQRATPCEVDLLGSDPMADLALVRLTPKAHGASEETGEEPTAARFLEPEDGQDAFAGETWTILRWQGEVRAVPGEDLLRVDSGDRRLAATPLVAGLGGAPIVDREGRLLGRWAWTLPGEVARAVPAAKIRRLLEKQAGDDGGGRKRIRDAEFCAGTTFPQLCWTPGKDRSAAVGDATRRISLLPDKCICKKCDGSGQFNNYEKRLEGRKFKTIDHWIECPDCSGDGLKDGETLWRETRVLAEKLANLSGDDRYSLLRDLEESVARLVETNFTYYARKLNDSASEVLRLRGLTPGNGVVFVLPFGEWPERPWPAWPNEDVRAGVTTAFGPLLFPAPRARSVIREKQAALVLGVIGGTVSDGDMTWTVVEHASVVPINPENTKLGK
jgi:hypothetical protein